VAGKDERSSSSETPPNQTVAPYPAAALAWQKEEEGGEGGRGAPSLGEKGGKNLKAVTDPKAAGPAAASGLLAEVPWEEEEEARAAD
jgi:hypothetical protein